MPLPGLTTTSTLLPEGLTHCLPTTSFVGGEKDIDIMPPCKNGTYWASLLELDNLIDVKLLEDKDVWKAATTWSGAFVNDPYVDYLNDNKQNSPSSKKYRKLVMSGCLFGWIRRKITITVDHGASLVVATPAFSMSGPRSRKDKLIDWAIAAVFKGMKGAKRKEYRKREQETKDKVGAVIREKIGARQRDMILINLVCTEQASRGRGYASALIEKITALADMLGVACWLESSNIENEPFYNSQGFKTVGEAVLGDTNPNWHKKPVVVQIMVREPQAHLEGTSTGGSVLSE